MSKSTDLPNFQHALPISLLRAREAVMREFTPFLRSCDLSPEQWRVIRALEQEDGLQAGELCQRCFLLAPSLSRIVQKLESRKLIRRQYAKDDKRCVRLHLTKKGRQLFHDIAPESIQQYANITEKFGADELDRLYQLLNDLVDVLNKK